MNKAQMSIPHSFICPISLDLFKDPVTLCTGQTYDRSTIEKWLAAGNLTCPVTMQKLHDLTMVPNHTLRHLIDEWLQMGPQLDPDYLATIDSLTSLKQNLQSHDATLEKKFQALTSIQSLITDESTSINSYLLQLGFLSLLLELLFEPVESKLSPESIKFAEQTLACILKLLPLSEYEPLNLLKGESKMESFNILLEHGTIILQEGLCHLIEAISSSQETIELCAILGQNRRLLRLLVVLVQQTCGAPEAGIKAISALCSLESNRENLLQEAVMRGLIVYISNMERRERNLAPKAMATIDRLLALETAKEAVINDPNGVSALVKMVFRVSDHEGSGSAVRSLMVICSDSLPAREEAICSGVLTQLLLLLQSQCSSRTKTKARMLLKLLRSKWNEEPKHL